MQLTTVLRAALAQLPASQHAATTVTKATASTAVPAVTERSKRVQKRLRQVANSRDISVEELLEERRAEVEGPPLSTEDASRQSNPLGSHIYFYNNLRTKRVIYSLYQNLYNNKAMKQITFMGKKTVPAKLRKDMWTPFLIASFTKHETGLKAFQHLRELRKLHETQWDIKLLKMKIKERSKLLQDQRANSIADLAAICARDVKGEEKVRLRWVNIYDAEYAAEWPETVVHDTEREQPRYTAPKAGKFEAGQEESGVPKIEGKSETEAQPEIAKVEATAPV